MSDSQLLMLIVLAGIGTYLMRLLPMLYGQRLAAGRGAIALVLGALGVAAITALIVVSLLGLVAQQAGWIRLSLSALLVLLVLRLARNVGVATLVGALGYGLLSLVLT